MPNHKDFHRVLLSVICSHGVLFFRLAKSISSQIKDRLNKSHESFATALKMLESRHSGRLDKIEEERLKMRKIHAPRVAKLALESTSLRDVVLNGNGGYYLSASHAVY